MYIDQNHNVLLGYCSIVRIVTKVKFKNFLKKSWVFNLYSHTTYWSRKYPITENLILINPYYIIGIYGSTFHQIITTFLANTTSNIELHLINFVAIINYWENLPGRKFIRCYSIVDVANKTSELLVELVRKLIVFVLKFESFWFMPVLIVETWVILRLKHCSTINVCTQVDAYRRRTTFRVLR